METSVIYRGGGGGGRVGGGDSEHFPSCRRFLGWNPLLDGTECRGRNCNDPRVCAVISRSRGDQWGLTTLVVLSVPCVSWFPLDWRTLIRPMAGLQDAGIPPWLCTCFEAGDMIVVCNPIFDVFLARCRFPFLSKSFLPRPGPFDHKAACMGIGSSPIHFISSFAYQRTENENDPLRVMSSPTLSA